MTDETPGLVRLATSLTDHVPAAVEDLVAPLYYRYNGWQADRDHREPTLTAARTADAPDHVLLVVVDALRPDAVPDCGLPFSHAVTPATWTFPAMTSVHTGTYPHEHGAAVHTHPDSESVAMPAQHDSTSTLAHVHEAAGYETYAGCSFIVPFLATRGWYQTNRVYGDVGAADVLGDYESWRRGRERTFGYVHLGDLHHPVEPPERYRAAYDIDPDLDVSGFGGWTDSYDASPEAERFREHRLRQYRAALDYVSAELTALVERVSDDTLIVVTGDHGELLYEHAELDRQFADSRPNFGVGHGGTPFDELARVPVAVSHPDGRDLSPTGGWASLIDLPRTICAVTVEEAPFGGYDWAEPIPDGRAAICEASRYGTERKAVYRGDRTCVRSESDGVTLVGPVGGEYETASEADASALLSAFPDYWDDFAVGGEDAGAVATSQLEALGYL